MDQKQSPASNFLARVIEGVKDPTRKRAIHKHQTEAGRPGDPKAPGDPDGFGDGEGDHKEPGGGPELPTQKPHGRRVGAGGAGGKRRLMALLNAAMKAGDSSIPSWTDMEDMDYEAVRALADEKFSNVDQMLADMPKGKGGKPVGPDDVPEGLVERHMRRAANVDASPEPEEEGEAPRPKRRSRQEREELEREREEIEREHERLQVEDAEKDPRNRQAETEQEELEREHEEYLRREWERYEEEEDRQERERREREELEREHEEYLRRRAEEEEKDPRNRQAETEQEELDREQEEHLRRRAEEEEGQEPENTVDPEGDGEWNEDGTELNTGNRVIRVGLDPGDNGAPVEDVGHSTNIGGYRKSKGNQDAVLAGKALNGVADGVGGSNAGHQASARAARELLSREGFMYAANEEEAVSAVRRALAHARDAVTEEFPGGATTASFHVLRPDGVAIFAHVGDSQAYYVTPDGEVMKMTQEQGGEAWGFRSNVVVNTLGGGHRLTDDEVFTFQTEPGSYIIHTTDGVGDYLSEKKIQEIVREAKELGLPAQDIAERITTAALTDNDLNTDRVGSHDNVTASVTKIGKPKEQPSGSSFNEEDIAFAGNPDHLKVDVDVDVDEHWTDGYYRGESRDLVGPQLIALVDGQVAGYLHLRPVHYENLELYEDEMGIDLDDPNWEYEVTLEPQQIFVEREFRRKGIATELWRQAKEQFDVQHSPNRTPDGKKWSAAADEILDSVLPSGGACDLSSARKAADGSCGKAVHDVLGEFGVPELEVKESPAAQQLVSGKVKPLRVSNTASGYRVALRPEGMTSRHIDSEGTILWYNPFFVSEAEGGKLEIIDGPEHRDMYGKSLKIGETTARKILEGRGVGLDGPNLLHKGVSAEELKALLAGDTIPDEIALSDEDVPFLTQPEGTAKYALGSGGSSASSAKPGFIVSLRVKETDKDSYEGPGGLEIAEVRAGAEYELASIIEVRPVTAREVSGRLDVDDTEDGASFFAHDGTEMVIYRDVTDDPDLIFVYDEDLVDMEEEELDSEKLTITERVPAKPAVDDVRNAVAEKLSNAPLGTLAERAIYAGASMGSIMANQAEKIFKRRQEIERMPEGRERASAEVKLMGMIEEYAQSAAVVEDRQNAPEGLRAWAEAVVPSLVPLNNLPPALREAVKEEVDFYTSDGHEAINRALRRGGEIPEEAELIDMAFSLQEPLKKGITLYRGDPSGARAKNLQTGDIVVDPGYLSSSISPGQARVFANGEYLNTPGVAPESTMYEVEVPAGVRLLDLLAETSNLSATDLADLSNAQIMSLLRGEKEVLIPRGIPQEVLSVDEHEDDITGQTIFYVRVRLRPDLMGGDKLASGLDQFVEDKRSVGEKISTALTDEDNAALSDEAKRMDSVVTDAVRAGKDSGIKKLVDRSAAALTPSIDRSTDFVRALGAEPKLEGLSPTDIEVSGNVFDPIKVYGLPGTGMSALHKQTWSETGRHNGGHVEALAYGLAGALELEHFFPATRLVGGDVTNGRLDPIGSLMQLIPDADSLRSQFFDYHSMRNYMVSQLIAKGMDPDQALHYATFQAQMLGLYDYIVSNPDRHDANILIDSNGDIFWIDSGMVGRPELSFGLFESEFMPPEDEILDSVKEHLKNSVNNLTRVHADWKRRLETVMQKYEQNAEGNPEYARIAAEMRQLLSEWTTSADDQDFITKLKERIISVVEDGQYLMPAEQ